MLENIDLLKIKVIVNDAVETKLKPVIRELKSLGVESRKTRRDINMIIGTFDTKDLELEVRVEQLEKRVGIKN